MWNKRIKRVFHRYEKLEEYHAGMWRIVNGEDRWLYQDAARCLMKNEKLFFDSMMRAVNEWPISCEANLTSRSINRRAWLGHAGCCIATSSPEDITRQAWWELSQEEQDRANAAADRAIEEWEKKYLEKISA